MTLKYEILKRLVKAANIKKRWTGMSKDSYSISFLLEYLIPWPFNGFASGFESFGWTLMFFGGRKLVLQAMQGRYDTEKEP